MNGVRSISMRKGYLLTALAAAVLLAASSGTAYAQSIGFVGTSSTMMEGATPGDKTPNPITIDINVSGLTSPSEGVVGDLEDGLGTVTLDARRRRCVPWAIATRRVTIGGFGWIPRAQPSMRPSSSRQQRPYPRTPTPTRRTCTE